MPLNIRGRSDSECTATSRANYPLWSPSISRSTLPGPAFSATPWGGHGALVIALNNPTTYRSVSAFAPIVAPGKVPWGKKALPRFLGDDPDAWKRYDACELISKQAFGGRILIDQGLDDPFLAEQLQPERFERACENADQALELRRHAGYDHGYFFIQTFIEDHLQYHAAALA